jgi:hypothetical protein
MPDLGNSSVFSQTDGSNNTGTQPSWSGSAAPSTIDDAGRALQGAVFREWNWRSFTVTTTGAANAFVLTYSVAPAALYNGQRFGFVTNHAVTGAATLNINSLGAKAIVKDVGGTLTALASGDAPSGVFMEVSYRSGTDNFVWINRGQIPSSYYSPGGTDVALADGGTGASLTDPNADRIMFWDDSGGAVTWLTVGTGLAISTTTMAVDISGLTEDTSPDGAADFVMTYDNSAGTLKKVKPDNLVSAGGATILGSITTTSGNSASLGSLVLTDYKVIQLIFMGVSQNGVSNREFRVGNSTGDDVAITDTVAASTTVSGSVWIDLADGKGAASLGTASNDFVGLSFDSALSTATTTITVAVGIDDFDAGSIRVIGYK